MNDWACAEGTGTIAMVATTAAINFDFMDGFLPGFGGKVDGCVPSVNPSHRPRRTRLTHSTEIATTASAQSCVMEPLAMFRQTGLNAPQSKRPGYQSPAGQG